MKKFEIPEYYKSSIISDIKQLRKEKDPRKKDFSPTELNYGNITFYIARHFGFCYGVENAIETAYRIIHENPDKRIFLLSEMIHNPGVNADLKQKGVQFIMETNGNQIIPWSNLTSDDIVIIPAFGTTLEIEKQLSKIGIEVYQYNTTCPFVEKVWNRAEDLGKNNQTVIIHGKHNHEETRATFSHSISNGASLIVRDIKEAEILSKIILNKIDNAEFYNIFKGKYSEGFNVINDLENIGVVNQTTMLASETQAISDLLKEAMTEKYGKENFHEHFADTRDTLCYATNDNQQATYGLLKTNADLAIVVGGYNSSNTSHIVELLEKKFPTYFISSKNEIISKKKIKHFDLSTKLMLETENFLPEKDKISIALTCGASCPDIDVELVLKKIISYFSNFKKNLT